MRFPHLEKLTLTLDMTPSGEFYKSGSSFYFRVEHGFDRVAEVITNYGEVRINIFYDGTFRSALKSDIEKYVETIDLSISGLDQYGNSLIGNMSITWVNKF